MNERNIFCSKKILILAFWCFHWVFAQERRSVLYEDVTNFQTSLHKFATEVIGVRQIQVNMFIDFIE